MTDQDVRAFLERMADEEPIPFVDGSPLARKARRRATRTIVLAAAGLVAALALVFAGASLLPETSADVVPVTDTTRTQTPPPAHTAAPGFSTFHSALQQITIDYPDGWKFSYAAEPWHEGPVALTARDVDVIYDPSLHGDVYLVLASEPLGRVARSDWPVNPPSSTGICAHATGVDGGAIRVDGASGWIESCGSPTAGGHYVMVATDSRGYLIYLHVADDRALQRLYDGDFFDTLIETVDLEPDAPLGSSDPLATP